MTLDQIKDLLNQPHRESFLGGHFFGVYSECPWKFYLRYVLGYQPAESQRYFIRGQAIHSGIELCIADGWNPETALAVVDTYMTMHKEEIEPDFWDEDLRLVRLMMKDWLDAYTPDGFEPDADRYEELGCEIPGRLVLPNGYEMSVRLDRAVRSLENGRIYIIDTKTTSRDLLSPIKGLRMGDQGLSYLIAGRQIFGEPIAGIIVDVLMGKTLKTKVNHAVYRSPPITFSAYAEVQYQMNMIGLVSEVSQKVKTLLAGSLPPEILFYRKTDKCQMWGCPFQDICRTRHLCKDPVPPGFTKDPWAEGDAIRKIPTQKGDLLEVLKLLDNPAGE